MSARYTTVKQLMDALSKYPADMLVVSIHPGQDDWANEGVVDGVKVSEIKGYEVRSGWLTSPKWPAYDEDDARLMLLIHDFDAECLREWEDDVIDEIAEARE